MNRRGNPKPLGNDGIVIPTAEVAAVVRETIAELPGTDGQAVIIHRLARIARISEDGAYRRLSRLLSHRPVAMRADDADRVLLACGKWMEHEHDVTHLPASTPAARQMVGAYFDATGEEVSSDEKRTLAHRLYRFACGYFEDLLEQSAQPAAIGAAA